ncbi:putative phage abortive infection protein [Sutterella sp.]|uniref:putative phage abortive infection protein n=1 Tax=Sutterella sp. TaxID=1981025 RepID=UPI0026DF4F5D|nr:putative phage abortive infection protein [Sutterella sp.]MDO5531975.1 putative phage abortive infection protein [Sutterella sp.]
MNIIKYFNNLFYSIKLKFGNIGIKWLLPTCFVISICTAFVFIAELYKFYVVHFEATSHEYYDVESKFGNYSAGVYGTIFVALGFLVLIYTNYKQNLENQKASLKTNYFEMMNFHKFQIEQISTKDREKNEVVKGKEALKNLNMQLTDIFNNLKLIVLYNKVECKEDELWKIAYLIFCSGFAMPKHIKKENIIFVNKGIYEWLKDNPKYCDLVFCEFWKFYKEEKGVCINANGSRLSAYFRNMYSTIKMIDESSILSSEEKEDLIKILVAQLSDFEFNLLKCHVHSDVGWGWIDTVYFDKYIKKYFEYNY